jgi:hypothetical protein
MYVFLRENQLKDKARSVALRVEVIQAFRDPVTGKPRNRLVLYVGSIKQHLISEPLAQERFWRIADAKIARLGLPEDDVTALRDKILKSVPRPASLSEIAASLLSRHQSFTGIASQPKT